MIDGNLRARLAAAFLAVIGLSVVSVARVQEGLLINHNERSVRGLAKAYGFLIGQQMALEEIERRYPAMKAGVAAARPTFEAAFPRLNTTLEAELVSVVGVEKFPAFRDDLQKRIDDVRPPVDAEGASEFLRRVHDRAKGDGVEADVLGYFLALQYARQPVSEFTDGFRQRFQTDGAGKAQGIRLTVQLPRSWLAQEGERPHIVHKWTNEGGTGLSVITLDIRDTGGHTPTAREIAELIKSGEIRQEFSALGTVLNVNQFSVERQPGVLIELSGLQERAGIRLYSRGAFWQVYFRGKAIGIMCMAGRPESERAAVAKAWELLEPLCGQVVNSLVLAQVY